MATPATLVSLGRIWRYDLPPSDERLPMRSLYLAPDLVDWLRHRLPLEPRDRGRDLTPLEQVRETFNRYVAEEYVPLGDFQNIMPAADSVYEIKTTDVRILGWFWRCCHFVAAGGGMKREVKARGAIDALRRQVVAFRDRLYLDPPAFVRHEYNVRELLQV